MLEKGVGKRRDGRAFNPMSRCQLQRFYWMYKLLSTCDCQSRFSSPLMPALDVRLKCWFALLARREQDARSRLTPSSRLIQRWREPAGAGSESCCCRHHRLPPLPLHPSLFSSIEYLTFDTSYLSQSLPGLQCSIQTRHAQQSME